MQVDDKVLENEKTYDLVFWTAVNRMKRFLIPLINEALGTQYQEDSEVMLLPEKKVTEKTDSSLKENRMDVFARIGDELSGHKYHLELQTRPDNSMSLRISEYDLAAAFEDIEYNGTCASITIPTSVVIFLRSNSETPDYYTIILNYPGGSGSYKVPVIKLISYDVDAIFEKKLLLLLPFFVFNILMNDPQIMKDAERFISTVRGEMEKIGKYLHSLVEDQSISDYEMSHIVDWILHVMDKLTIKKESIRKELDNMSMELLRTETDEIYEAGQEEIWKHDIKRVMEKLKYTAEQAMDFLDVPASKRSKLITML